MNPLHARPQNLRDTKLMTSTLTVWLHLSPRRHFGRYHSALHLNQWVVARSGRTDIEAGIKRASCPRGLRFKTLGYSFAPLQLHVFRAMRESVHDPDVAKRPQEHPRGENRTDVSRGSSPTIPRLRHGGRPRAAGREGRLKKFRGKVRDYIASYWRVIRSDGDWEEHTIHGHNSFTGLGWQPLFQG